jgi:hypothetical protein
MGRPTPPADVALQLRRESGFGCCKCGHPIYDYHHIVPWEQEGHFRPRDMIILCPNHHREMKVTPRRLQYDIKGHPYNIRKGFPRGQLVSRAQSTTVYAGGLCFIDCFHIIRFMGEDLLSICRDRDGAIGLNARLYDKYDNLLVTLQENHWVDHERRAWDITFNYNIIKPIFDSGRAKSGGFRR